MGNTKFSLGRPKIANFNSAKTLKITNSQTLISTNISSFTVCQTIVFVAGDPSCLLTTTSCMVAALTCLLDSSNPCSVCEVWTVKTWNKLRKALGDARMRAFQRGKPHWTTAFSQIEAWITNRPTSVAASEPLSEVSSVADSGDDFSA